VQGLVYSTTYLTIWASGSCCPQWQPRSTPREPATAASSSLLMIFVLAMANGHGMCVQ